MKKIASIWQRIISYVIDFLIVNVIIAAPFDKLIEKNISIEKLLIGDLNNVYFVLVVSLVSGIISVFYWAILEYKIEQTLGCLIAGIKVKGEKLKFSQMFLRNISKISLLLLIIDSLPLLFKKEQRYTERLSKSYTIKNG